MMYKGTPLRGDNIDSITNELTDNDDKNAYEKTKEIVSISKSLSMYYSYFDTFASLCLNAAKEIVVFRPELIETINNELNQIDLSCYKDSMANLIRDDIVELREQIEEVKKS